MPPSSSFLTSISAIIPGAAQDAAGGSGLGPGQVDAFFGTPWVGVVALAVWVTVPIVLGYTRFRDADL